MLENIVIKKAAQHNLKNIDVVIPRNQLVVITGLSGSGKSSLAFDTIYAEGQRRYVESLSAYARQFLDRLQKPKAEKIEGLSPAIAIEQRTAGGTPRSTVATVTEIYDYLRLLYANVGLPHCPHCGKPLRSQSAQAITDNIAAYPEGKRLTLLAPVVSGRKGEHREVFDKLRNDGFIRARVDGEMIMLEDETPKLGKNLRHHIEVVIDRLISGKIDKARLHDSVELALKNGDGVMHVLIDDGSTVEEVKFCENLACVDCGVSFGKLLPRNFSFNAPYGACPTCNGLGVEQYIDPAKAVVDASLSIKNGAIPGWRRGPQRLIMYYNLLLRKLGEHLDFPKIMTTPLNKMPEEVYHALLYGTRDAMSFDFCIRRKRYHWSKPFIGVLESMRQRFLETDDDAVRERLSAYLSQRTCPKCHGERLNEVSRAVTVGGLTLGDFNALNIAKALQFIRELPQKLTKEQNGVATELLKEIASRLTFLCDVGLDYLTLNRVSSTLSGGEAQRIRLATQLGCGLVGVLYILDEPSIGLHQRDNDRLLATLEKLRDLGNTVLVVEHDLDTIRRADYVIDLGPGAGVNGGEVVAAATPAQLPNFPRSLTADFLAGRRSIEVPQVRQPGNGKFLTVCGASFHNLKNIDVRIPLGTFCCVSGVSGSGKSSLINGILVRALHAAMGVADDAPGACAGVDGMENVDKLIVIDQSPIGRTPRSNPATYVGAFDAIRKLFSELPESKVRGYSPGRFSFNVKGGRCEECKGDGIRKIEMQFLSDVYVECSVCGGKRFNAETLDIRFKKHNISEILDLTVNQAVELFSAIPSLARKFATLQEVGLGYVKLGQSATTLSGGEAQRVKLAAELSRVPRGHTVYVLDEPTTGLHLADIDQLLKVLYRLRDLGNTVIVIEHNLDVLKTADYLIDMGPEGGDAGGKIVVCGTPEKVAACKKSHTGRYLKPYLTTKKS